jgi:hypothetical protein
LPRLNIPPKYKSGLSRISSISDTIFDELTAALKEFNTLKIDTDAIAKIASLTPGITTDDLDNLLEVLLALQLARSLQEKTSEQFAEEVLKELETPGPQQLKLTDGDRPRFVNRLKLLLSFDSLALVAKARELQTEHGRVFLNGRVITDLRPVFRGSPDEVPLGVVLLHILKLSYLDRQREGDRGTFYIALDEDDIASLKRVLERAESKARTLRSTLKNAGIRCLGEARGV